MTYFNGSMQDRIRSVIDGAKRRADKRIAEGERVIKKKRRKFDAEGLAKIAEFNAKHGITRPKHILSRADRSKIALRTKDPRKITLAPINLPEIDDE